MSTVFASSAMSLDSYMARESWARPGGTTFHFINDGRAATHVRYMRG